MLINLSNHPLASWDFKQRSAAETHYGLVRDLPFPAVPPLATEDEITALADAYMSICLCLLAESPGIVHAVHLMGEFTFCFALAQKLLHKGIPCIASTTERLVEESENAKTVTFVFSQFRSYTLCN